MIFLLSSHQESRRSRSPWVVGMVVLARGLRLAGAAGELVHQLDELIRRGVVLAGQVAGLDQDGPVLQDRQLHFRLHVRPPFLFTINVTGSFAIGCLTVLLAKWLPHPNARLFLITGLLGGYTTFSAYTFESLSLWERGDRWDAFAYVFGSVVAGLLAVILGVAVARFIAPEVDQHAVVAASGPGPGEEDRV
jgi:protein CrcB